MLTMPLRIGLMVRCALVFGLLLAGPVTILAQSDEISAEEVAEDADRPTLEDYLALTEPGDDDVLSLSDADATDALSHYALRNDTVGTLRLLDAGVSPDVVNSAGTNALFTAIAADSLDVARILLQAGADPETPTAQGTPRAFAASAAGLAMQQLVVPADELDLGELLRDAARGGNADVVEQLLGLGADPDAVGPDGTTPLIEAVLNGDAALVDLFLASGAGADVHGGDDLSPLSTAILSGNEKVVGKLLAAGADPDAAPHGVPLLTAAIFMGQSGIADALLAAGANPEQESLDGLRPAAAAQLMEDRRLARRLGGAPGLATPPDIFAAISSGLKDVSKALEAGADPDALDKDGIPAIVAAAAYADGEMVRYLRGAGADITAVAPDGGGVLRAALANSPTNRPGVLSAIFEGLDDIGTMNSLLAESSEDGQSALLALAMLTAGEDPQTIFGPLEAQASKEQMQSAIVSYRGSDSVSVLEAAVLTGNAPLVSHFINDVGLTPDRTEHGTRLQDIARARQHWNVLLALPNDRVIPEGTIKGASQSVRMAFQRALADWGYYDGAIDGIFGPASRAAAQTFLEDRGRELRQMAIAGAASELGGISAQSYDDVDEDAATYSLRYQPEGSWCRWRVITWRTTSNVNSFVGCVAGEPNWNSNGFGLLEYPNGNKELRLFGPGGWQDTQQF